MRAIRRLPLVALIALAACDRLFDLQPVNGSQGPGVDATLAGERPAFCATAAIFDTFDNSAPCAFGVVNGPDQVSQHDGLLDIRFEPAQQGFAGCTAFQALDLTDAGVFTHVSPLDASLDSALGYTILNVRNHLATDTGFKAVIVYRTGVLYFEVNGLVYGTRDDVPGWWRIRRPRGTNDVVGEVSFDGITWDPLGLATVPLPSAFSLDLGAGLNGALPAPVEATFSVLGVCD